MAENSRKKVHFQLSSIAIMAITTSSSINVNVFFIISPFFMGDIFLFFTVQLYNIGRLQLIDKLCKTYEPYKTCHTYFILLVFLIFLLIINIVSITE